MRNFCSLSSIWKSRQHCCCKDRKNIWKIGFQRKIPPRYIDSKIAFFFFFSMFNGASFYRFFLPFLSALSFYPGSCSPGLFSFTTCFAKVLFLVVWVEIFLYLSFCISFSDHLNLLLCLILLPYFLLSVLFICCL